MDIQAEGKPDTEVQGDENAPKKGVKRGDGKVVETPLMRQYYEIKQQHPDAVLLFRVGDFYETFGEDAIFASKVLNIVLTRKANGSHTFIELAGFPHHALETYLYKLVRAGGKVAICEQLEDPKLTKKLVKRGVTELITPGISLNDRLLENGKNNFLCGLYPGQAGPAGWGASLRQAASKKKSKPAQEMGISFLDVSTGEFFVAEGNMEYIHKLIDNFQPSEIVMPRDYRDEFFRLFGNRYYVTVFEDWVFKPDFARELLLKHFKTNSLKGFGVENMVAAQIAAASCLHYLIESKHEQSSHISSLQKIVESRYVWMDAFTLRNLELLQPSSTAVDDSKAAENSLWAVLDKTSTPMGSRLLRRMICLPLKDKDQLEERFDYVQTLVENREAADFLEDKFSQIGDLERLLSNPLVRCWLKPLMPGAYRYLPVFARLRREYAEGRDRILRGATALLFIHAPRASRFGAEDANLACQNASLLAEALGVSQIYMGFVLTAIRQDRHKALNRMLGIGDRRVCAILAFGMPEFLYPNYIDRDPAPRN